MRQKRLLLFFAAIISIELALILFSWKLTYFTNPYVVINPDNCVSAQTARNLVDGKGYRTDNLSLYEVALYKKKGWLSDGPPWRNTYRFPLPILSMAGLFKIFGYSNFTANFLYPSLFHLLSVLALFILAIRLFKDETVAFLSCLFFMTNPGLLCTMLSKSECADIFFFILSLLVFFVWKENRRNILLCLLGGILGLMFLNRFNLGAIMFLTYLLAAVSIMGLNFKGIVFYMMGFVLPIAPFLLYNEATLGTLFFSSNSYFQFIENSIISKYMNPWWKLQYSIDITKPYIYFLQRPDDFFTKAYSYLKKYTIPGLIQFNGSLWWWIPLLYSLLKRTTDSKKKYLWLIFLMTLILHIFLIAPLGLNMSYLHFLFVPLILIVAKTVCDWYAAFFGTLDAHHNKVTGNILHGEIKNHFYLYAVLCAVPISLYGRMPVMFIVVLFCIAIAVNIWATLKKRPLLFIWGLTLLLLTSSVYIADKRYHLFDIEAYTAENPDDLQRIEQTITPDQFVITTHYWNPSWFSRRPTLPIPEYPDEIYLLIKQYGMDIRIIYLSHLETYLKYANSRTPISLSSYERLYKNRLPIRGFTNIELREQGALLLYRDQDTIEDVLQTESIDVGADRDNSHLVYGFSPPDTLSGKTVCWINAGNSDINYDTQEFLFHADESVISYNNPHAEVTFFKGKKPINQIQIMLFSHAVGDTMTVVLNSNLFSYGDVGSLVDSVVLKSGWNKIGLQIPAPDLREGINKLSFWFGSLEVQQGVRENSGIAIDKIFFSYYMKERR